jgi:hypothetical protein
MMMKKLLIIIFLFISIVINATKYYVSTTGNDSNMGTINNPWATWDKITSHGLVAGDTVYIRGGIYRSIRKGDYSGGYLTSFNHINGTVSKIIKIWAYPSEVPIMNYDNITVNLSYMNGLSVRNSSYLWVKGLKIIGLAQPSTGSPVTGLEILDATNIIIENCEISYIGGYGITTGTYQGATNNILIKNCDVHHLADPYSLNGPYEDANGFSITGSNNASTNITFDGCRAWFVCDDGWDFYRWDGFATINNCWAFWNGYDEDFNSLGNGQGFKLGPNSTDKSMVHLRTITNSLAVGNLVHGFDQNTSDYSCIMWFYNNLAYKNGSIGFGFTHIPQPVHIFRNNISYANEIRNIYDSPRINWIDDHNSWNGGIIVTDSDFISLDETQLDNPRKVDGNLPVILFGRLTRGSDLINAGINVGISYKGKAPCLGPFEYTHYLLYLIRKEVMYNGKIETIWK